MPAKHSRNNYFENTITARKYTGRGENNIFFRNENIILRKCYGAYKKNESRNYVPKYSVKAPMNIWRGNVYSANNMGSTFLCT